MRRFDSGKVLVLGNGPVGQTAALLLARWGIPVTILDARAERDPIGSKAICQQRDVLEVWTDTYVNLAGPVLAARIAAVHSARPPSRTVPSSVRGTDSPST